MLTVKALKSLVPGFVVQPCKPQDPVLTCYTVIPVLSYFIHKFHGRFDISFMNPYIGQLKFALTSVSPKTDETSGDLAAAVIG